MVLFSVYDRVCNEPVIAVCKSPCHIALGIHGIYNLKLRLFIVRFYSFMFFLWSVFGIEYVEFINTVLFLKHLIFFWRRLMFCLVVVCCCFCCSFYKFADVLLKR